jgi:hypothetical protein
LVPGCCRDASLSSLLGWSGLAGRLQKWICSLFAWLISTQRSQGDMCRMVSGCVGLSLSKCAKTTQRDPVLKNSKQQSAGWPPPREEKIRPKPSSEIQDSIRTARISYLLFAICYFLVT